MGILDRRFKYTPSYETNVAKTIKREQERLKAVKERERAHDRIIRIPERKRA